MNVLHIIPNLPIISSTSAVGGSASSMWTLAQKQAEYHKVFILSNIIELKNIDIIGINPRIKVEDLSIKTSRRTISFGITFLYKILKNKLLRNKDIDVVHLHSGFLDYLSVALVISLLFRKPLVYSVYCPAMTRKITKISISLLRIFGFPRLIISAISHNTYRYLVEQGIPQDKLIEIHPALDIDGLQKSKLDTFDARRILEIPLDQKIILFVGSYRPEKNLIGLVRSMEQVREDVNNVHLIATTELANKGDTQVIKDLDFILESRKLAKSVTILGIIDNMFTLMCAADICVFPFFHTEGPSDYFMAALESMALEKPVIVSPVGGMTEVVKDMNFGVVVDPHSIEEISYAIIELCHNPNKCDLIGRNGRMRVQNLFDVNIIREKFNKIYNELR